MIERIKKGWRLFEASKPGNRFRERFRRRQQSGRGTFSPTRLFYVVGGMALIVVRADSTGQCNGGCKCISRGTVGEGLTGSAVELLRDRIEVALAVS